MYILTKFRNFFLISLLIVLTNFYSVCFSEPSKYMANIKQKFKTEGLIIDANFCDNFFCLNDEHIKFLQELSIPSDLPYTHEHTGMRSVLIETYCYDRVYQTLGIPLEYSKLEIAICKVIENICYMTEEKYMKINFLYFHSVSADSQQKELSYHRDWFNRSNCFDKSNPRYLLFGVFCLEDPVPISSAAYLQIGTIHKSLASKFSGSNITSDLQSLVTPCRRLVDRKGAGYAIDQFFMTPDEGLYVHGRSARRVFGWRDSLVVRVSCYEGQEEMLSVLKHKKLTTGGWKIIPF